MRDIFLYNNTIIDPSIIGNNGNYYFRIVGCDLSKDPNYNYIENILGYVCLLTDDSNFMKNLANYDLQYKSSGNICLCGCDKCDSLFIVKHLPSSVQFAVGSTCIHKFFSKEMESKMKKHLSDELCLDCHLPLYFKTSKYNKRNAFRNQSGYCDKCWKQ